MQVILCIGISIPPGREYHGIFCDHFLNEPYGMMEQWNVGELGMKMTELSDIHIEFTGPEI